METWSAGRVRGATDQAVQDTHGQLAARQHARQQCRAAQDGLVRATQDAHTSPRAPFKRGEDQSVRSSNGGDIGPSVFQWVLLPSAEAAAAIARRCVLVRGAFDVWACVNDGDGEGSDGGGDGGGGGGGEGGDGGVGAGGVGVGGASGDVGVGEVNDDVTDSFSSTTTRSDASLPKSQFGKGAWLALSTAVNEAPASVQQQMLCALADSPWKAEITSFGAKKPYTINDKVELLDRFSILLNKIPGRVDLRDPE
eukprot:1650353-Pleurochrysis_carterae.AAC.3